MNVAFLFNFGLSVVWIENDGILRALKSKSFLLFLALWLFSSYGFIALQD